MRQFYRTFPIRQTLSNELSWSHYNLLMRIEDNKAREFYANESVKGNWSVRQLKRQIGAFYYERLLASQDKDSVTNEMGLPEKVEPNDSLIDHPKDYWWFMQIILEIESYGYVTMVIDSLLKERDYKEEDEER